LGRDNNWPIVEWVGNRTFLTEDGAGAPSDEWSKIGVKMVQKTFVVQGKKWREGPELGLKGQVQ